ncbi:uncharacterized protein BXZ73DRAFT_49638 [Epithele typhae]|uniref:uncharacterized protein n=1 Tax=Epithele typhae TaxID=378194 RepID=UPI002008BF5E|nr:uncharacterized protein BXZ73DRAFT_49638 [Epithele typhae]KAH9925935.1 hypothetical protein BXZ73DRAFT_49638 [Epithele typhae]
MPLFSVYAPDYTDEDAINRRLAARTAHLAKAAGNPSMKIGGAMLTPNEALDSPDASKKMAGSFMIWECENYAAAIKMLEEDPYWSGNVWDKEKTVIRPWVSPVPL